MNPCYGSRTPDTMESAAAASFGDLAESVFETQELLSALISPTVNVNDVSSSDHRKNSANEARVASSEVHESQRQRRVELELYHKVTNLRHSLLDFGETQGIRYVTYGGEHHLKEIMDLITKDLSEPYSIYTYRYFIYQWPKLCYLAVNEDGKVVGTIVCKMENTKGPQVGRSDYIRRGYIAMLAVDKTQRRKKIGTALVVSAVEALMMNGCDEVVLETETTNQAALHLYENLGFAKHKRLLKYYLNGVDAFRLKLWIKYPAIIKERATGPKEEMNDGTVSVANPSLVGESEEN